MAANRRIRRDVRHVSGTRGDYSVRLDCGHYKSMPRRPVSPILVCPTCRDREQLERQLAEIYNIRSFPRYKDGWPKWVWMPEPEDFVSGMYCKRNAYCKRCTAQELYYMFGHGRLRSSHGIEYQVSDSDLDGDPILREAFQAACLTIDDHDVWRLRISGCLSGGGHLVSVSTVIQWNDHFRTDADDMVELIGKTLERLGYSDWVEE